MSRLLIALLALMIWLTGTLLVPAPAAACLLTPLPEASLRLKQQTEAADLIIVGQVTAERPYDGPSRPGLWQPAFASLVRPVALLKGATPDAEIEVSPLGGLGPDCTGGPRLELGERVLLFLRRGDPHRVADGAGTRPAGWSIVLGGRAKYVFQDSRAALDLRHILGFLPGDRALEPAGQAEDLVKDAAVLAGSPEDQIERALQFVQGPGSGPGVGPTNPTSSLDFPVLNGWFYSQAAGQPSRGFVVLDDAGARFWTEFQRLGSVDGVGYPISQRFVWNGFPSQAFQKMVFQWRADEGRVYAVNVLDLLHEQGRDDWLRAARSTPGIADWSSDDGKPWPEVVAAHQALLTDPDLRAATSPSAIR